MSRTTDLFAAEAELRDAADVYSTATARTASIGRWSGTARESSRRELQRSSPSTDKPTEFVVAADGTAAKRKRKAG